MKRFNIIVLGLLIAVAAKASPVSRSEASALAAAFLKQPVAEQAATSFANFYVFNGNHGFVILAADDCVIPVLGYSLEQPFCADMVESTLEWLQAYNQEIQAIKEARIEASTEVKAAWASLREDGTLPVCNRYEVNPLVFTHWRQGSPYNMYCPEGSVTGCVAMVMAQIMKYWECPTRGVGSHSYYYEPYGTLSANFGATSYDWDNMPAAINNNSANAAKQAVATLLYHCGVSVDMKYSPDGSSTPSTKVLDAMPQYFSYDPSMSLEYKSNYTDNQWKQLLKSELDALRPMFYAGQTRAAHAFICDGYDASDYFHFNWGWGGTNDGYYAIGALNPGTYGPYNAINYAIVGIKPADGGGPAIPAPVDLDVYPSGYDVVLEWWMPVDHPSYTFKVSRNGTQIASGLTEPAFVDHNASQGSFTYQVWAVLNGVDSQKKATYEIELVQIEVESSDPSQGTVTGAGLAEIDVLHIVNAVPKEGFAFLCWMENGEVVSTRPEYMFNVTGNRHLVAQFSGLGVEEEETSSVVYQVEIFTLNGVKLESIKENAHGVYLLRLTTDKGIVTKKIVK